MTVIPEKTISLATLEYLGFTPAVAAIVWRNWETSPPHVQRYNGFLSYAMGMIETKPDNAFQLDHDWHGVMQGWGVNTELIEAIMDPDFEQIRLSQSAKSWVLDTFGMNWRRSLAGVRVTINLSASTATSATMSAK